LEKVKKDLRIAEKRDAEVKSKYKQVLVDLEKSCEKMNSFLVLLTTICRNKKTTQSVIVSELGEDCAMLIELIENGGNSTLWATTHLIGCLCKNETNTETIGGGINREIQTLFVEKNLLQSVVKLLFRLVDEDTGAGTGRGEWRHCLEVLYWMLKNNANGVGIARDEGLLSLLFDLSTIELPFAEFPESGVGSLQKRRRDRGDNDNDNDDEDDYEDDDDDDDDIDVNVKVNVNVNEHEHENDDTTSPHPNQKIFYYPIPAGAMDDPSIDGEEFDYHYCTKCFVPFDCKRSLRGRWKLDDGGVFSTHLMSLLFELDAISQESCRREDGRLGNAVEVGREVSERVSERASQRTPNPHSLGAGAGVCAHLRHQ